MTKKSQTRLARDAFDRVSMKTPNEQKKVFFVAACLAIYEKDEQVRQRHINILIESETGALTKNHLGQVNRSVVARLKAENDVEPDQFKDMVILSISPLGLMTDAEFHGQSVQETKLDS